MISIKNKSTGQYVGSITELQLRYLIDELEEESKEDKDYWLNKTQIEIFKENGADSALIALLETALGSSEEVEIIWEKS